MTAAVLLPAPAPVVVLPTGECAYCGASGTLAPNGRVPRHRKWVIRKAVDRKGRIFGYPFRSAWRCKGSGKLPEVVAS